MPGYLVHRNHKITNVNGFKLTLRVICYTAIVVNTLPERRSVDPQTGSCIMGMAESEGL